MKTVLIVVGAILLAFGLVILGAFVLGMAVGSSKISLQEDLFALFLIVAPICTLGLGLLVAGIALAARRPSETSNKHLQATPR